MLFKVKGISDGEWDFFQCQTINYYRKLKVADLDCDYKIMDVRFCPDRESGRKRRSIVANLVTDTGKEYTIIFDTLSYLCNDRGEIIESIFPDEVDVPLEESLEELEERA